MWIIVAVTVATQTIAPFPHGTDFLFPTAEVCTAAAKLLVPFAEKNHVSLGCKFVRVYGGDKEEAF